MKNQSSFQVYNASAGSGKTFTLVKEYLKLLLESKDLYLFQKILAVTFTNKAAGEMKERVLETLDAIANKESNDLFEVLLQETSINRTEAQEKSKKIINTILQNYSSFSITTIDSFTHKIIKSFAYDLGLSLNFEVEMDATSLLSEAIDVLISKIGSNKELTKLLVGFALEKADEDKSWDITRELNEFSKILLNEEDSSYFKKIQDKSIQDFFTIIKKLKEVNQQIEQEFTVIGTEALQLISSNGLETTDFAFTGECPKHFKKLLSFKTLKTEDLKFEGRINKNFEENKNLYAGKASKETKEIINSIYDNLKDYYYQSKTLFNETSKIYTLNKLALKSIMPLAVLNNVNNELQVIKEKNNIRLNAEFNTLISENIKGQPAPFIYERIGERFTHYFIDEMQDTSTLQWENLIPLINNVLAQENSSLLLVGDGKQAIYRWRGGKAEQFINLSTAGVLSNNPFSIPKTVNELERNFRSYSEIITFNNDFFKHLANFFQNESYKKLFIEGNKQLTNSKIGGCVSLTFLEKEEDKEAEEIRFPKEVLAKINSLKNEFSLGEICVLTRSRKDGVAVANYLAENNIPIVSSETLLLQNSSKVQFIINLLQTIQHPEDKESLLEVLFFLHAHLKIEEDKHSFFVRFIAKNSEEIYEGLESYGIKFNINVFQQLPFYEKIEEIIRAFSLSKTSNAYLQFFLDIVLEQQQKNTSIADFLEYWEKKKDVLSIVAPETNDAVQIMTIHKSKGLEFPIVIFPYDLDVYREINPKTWLSNLPKELYEGLENILVSSTSELQFTGVEGELLYAQRKEALELDNFNLLYVALTRAVEQLHIITDLKIKAKTEEENTKYYSGIFINFLKEKGIWNKEQKKYELGNSVRVSVPKKSKNKSHVQEHFITNSWKEHNIKMLASSSALWDTTQEKAIEYGNLIHEMMAEIYCIDDIDKVIELYTFNGVLPQEKAIEIKNKIQHVVMHSKLQEYYQKNNLVYNEKEIVDVDGQTLIPDRLVVLDKGIVIIDYKTGAPHNKYKQQLLKYEQALHNMEQNVIKKILVYIGEQILIEEV